MNQIENNGILEDIKKLKEKKTVKDQLKEGDDFSIHIRSPKDITGKQALLMIPITKFFTVKEHITQFLDIIEGRTKISLRLIDWFVTNYSKKNNTFYNINHYNTPVVKNKTKKKISSNFDQYFNVFNNYKCQLKAYSKLHFDPFCRRTRISFYYQKDKSILTTVGQLNFFKWAIENGIIDYIKNNLDEIDADMNKNIRKNYSGKKSIKKTSLSPKDDQSLKNRKKRRELSSCATKQLNRHNHNIVLSFD